MALNELKQELLAKLSLIGQEHLLRFWDDLNADQQEQLQQQVLQLNSETLLQQQALLKANHKVPQTDLQPFLDYSKKGNKDDYELGRKLIAEGKVGCLLIAGGQGTRLRFKGPKGMFPITPVTLKSLFQFFVEKVKAASDIFGQPLQLAIMTSPLNDDETRRFFASHHFFGLHKDQVSFFTQSTLPLLDKEGNLFLEEKDKIAVGPDGNGYSLKCFYESSIWSKWHQKGITCVNYVLIDNPLADPFDVELVGSHMRRSVDVTLKCTERRDAQEKVGVVVKENNAVRVVEYSEMPDTERNALTDNGSLKHLCANLSLFCFNMSFIKSLTTQKMPLHLAFKAVPYVDSLGNLQHPTAPMAWKFETFIFDVLKSANSIHAILYPREECFAPLKNASGPNSIEQVQQSLQQQAKLLFKSKTGSQAPNGPFELPPHLFYS
ncbi:MAG: UTP--glucose-1-phosphate uridylyltransferase [Parachlamydiaceae bacterium]|nr:UTP--glucose-1-phosphate uridylyltransferase [Parachlamydiaceae bacterium]